MSDRNPECETCDGLGCLLKHDDEVGWTEPCPDCGSDRSPADVLANAIFDPEVMSEEDAEVYAAEYLDALADAGFLLVRPGDPWTDTDGRRWAFTRTSVRRINRSTDHMLAELALLPADDVEDPTDG